MPTAISQGYPGLYVAGPQFVGVPKATPDEVVARLSTAFGKVYRNPDVVKRLDTAGIVVRFLPKEDANRVVRDESAKWTKIIKDADVKID